MRRHSGVRRNSGEAMNRAVQPWTYRRPRSSRKKSARPTRSSAATRIFPFIAAQQPRAQGWIDRVSGGFGDGRRRRGLHRAHVDVEQGLVLLALVLVLLAQADD